MTETTLPRRPGARQVPIGHVRRGFRFRAYPTAEQRDALLTIQTGLLWCWNTMVQLDDDVSRWRIGWALASRLIESKPQAPDYPSLPTDAARAAAKREHRGVVADWWRRLRALDIPDSDWYWSDWQALLDSPERAANRTSKHARIQDYQVFEELINHGYVTGPGQTLPAVFYRQALVKIYRAAWSAVARGQRPPRSRKRVEDMPIVIGSGDCLRLESLGPRPGCSNGKPGWLNASVKLPGVPGRIACRIGPEQLPIFESAIQHLEGLSLVHEADGWYAAIRHDVPEPSARRIVAGSSCGIDVGLVKLAVLDGSDGAKVSVDNPRLGWSMRRVHAVDGGMAPEKWRKALRERLARAFKAQDIVTTVERDDELLGILSGRVDGAHPMRYVEFLAFRQAAGLKISRLQCRAARNVRQLIRERLFRAIDAAGYEFIFVEALAPTVGTCAGVHQSGMRLVASMVRDRYGDAVIEVDAYLSSHQCSRCGHVGDRSWSDMPDRIGHCDECGHSEDSDANAARVIRLRGLGKLSVPDRAVERRENSGQRSRSRKMAVKSRRSSEAIVG